MVWGRSPLRFCQASAPSTRTTPRGLGFSRSGVRDSSRLAKLWNDGYMNASAANHADVVDAANTEPLPGLGADLLAVVARLNRLATQRIQMPLPAAQARLLSTIEAHGEARIGDLAAVDHCSQPTMTTQVRRLEDAGLVTRTVDPGDARAVRIRITADGIRTLNAVRVDRAAAIEPQLALLSPADREVLKEAVDVLRRLLENAATSARRNTL
jgi:DNA-binding MarR family transcriptional regulator